MKKIFFATIMVALATALPKFSKAQVPDTSTIDKLQRYVAGPLDKTQVPTGFLEDYVAPFIPMAAFNGNLSDSNKIEINLLRLLYFQLFSSYCQTGTNNMASITTVNNIIKQHNKSDSATPIPVLIGQYNAVKANAFSSNLLSYNATQRKVYDVPGRTQSPYDNKVLFAAAPAWQYSHTGTQTFVFKPNMVWGNSGLTVSQMQVNF